MTYADLLNKLIEENQQLLLEVERLKEEIKKSSCSWQDESEPQ